MRRDSIRRNNGVPLHKMKKAMRAEIMAVLEKKGNTDRNMEEVMASLVALVPDCRTI